MASHNGKSKSSGLRILWIPGGRKSHPKGRYDATNKTPAHRGGQKKSEVWSLGGSKIQKDFLKAEPDTSLLDGPSVSGLSSLSCAVGAAGIAAKCATAEATVHLPATSPPSPANASDEITLAEIKENTPSTPNSTTSTAPLLSPPLSPQPANDDTMPSKTTAPVIITTTATAEIIEENRFAILGKDQDLTYEIDVYDTPKDSVKHTILGDSSNTHLDNSAGTNNSSMATSPAPSSSNSPQKSDVTSNKSNTSSPSKRHKSPRRNHNNNHPQSDVNSIESISDNVKIPDNLNAKSQDILMDEEYHNKETLQKTKRKKKKKINSIKEMDQLDGVPNKSNLSEASNEEDEKVVTCLYYTLMCCDCTIS